MANTQRDNYNPSESIDHAEPGFISKKPAGAGQPYPAHDPYRPDRYCQTLAGFGFMPDKAHMGGGDTTYDITRGQTLGDEYGCKNDSSLGK